MTRVFNFSAGPAALPEPVLRQAAEEMLDWHGSGMSVMEMSHRGKEFIAIHAEAESLLRELMGVPSNHKVPFLLEHGQIIGRLIYERMTETPDLVYGRDLKSNYQGQGVKLSKHFK